MLITFTLARVGIWISSVASSLSLPTPNLPYSFRPITYVLPSSSRAKVWCWAQEIASHLCLENCWDNFGLNCGANDFNPIN